jgi:hypothetical protein
MSEGLRGTSRDVEETRRKKKNNGKLETYGFGGSLKTTVQLPRFAL